MRRTGRGRPAGTRGSADIRQRRRPRETPGAKSWPRFRTGSCRSQPSQRHLLPLVRRACGKGEPASSNALHQRASMVTDPATEKVEVLLRPLSAAAFLEGLSGGRFVHMPGKPDFERVRLLGDDPAELLIGAWESVASKLGFHAVTASGPPPATGPAVSKEDFRNRIRLFHERGYSVRFPDLRPF